MHPELPQSPLTVLASATSDGLTVRLRGELDLTSASRLLEFSRDLPGDEPGLVVLDLAGLTFCDARGVTTLLQVQRRVEAAGGRLVVHGARGLPRRVLALTGVNGVLRVVDGDREDVVDGATSVDGADRADRAVAANVVGLDGARRSRDLAPGS